MPDDRIMMAASLLETTGIFLAVLTPLVVVPLTIITFYLRSLREQQVAWHADLSRRLDGVEAAVGELRSAIGDFERDFTTKEEWLRECMYARRLFEQLTQATFRLKASMRSTVSADDQASTSKDGR